MIANLNSYVTQRQASAPINNLAQIPPIATNPHPGQKIPDPPLFAGDRSKAQAWIMDIRLKLTADTQLFRTEQAKMTYTNSCLEGPVRDQIHPFIRDDLTFKFADANAMFSFLTSLYDDPDRRRSAVSVLGKLHQRNKAFTDFIPGFTRLVNDVWYMDDQSRSTYFPPSFPMK